ncbi:MAG: SpoIIE family protein phosphatase [Synergistaceae bacterium]|nr:SpoIIE family protein phosphatase [Synergistaceae bacterium]
MNNSITGACGGASVSLEVAGFRFDGANLLEMLDEALVIWEAQGGQILYANEAARALYGYGCGEIDDLFMEEIFPGWEEDFRGGAFSLRTAVHRNKNGIFFPVQATFRPLAEDAGGLMVMTASDVSPENMARDSVALASAIQRGFLPPDLDGDGRVEVRSIHRPMFMISGDLYGYHWDEGEGILGGYLFDVMGHGVPAALQTSALMVLFRQAFEDAGQAGDALEDKLRWVNSAAESRVLDDSFAAAICFRLNLEKRTMEYCAAGINSFFWGSKEDLKKVPTPGSLLGVPGDPAFGSGVLPVSPGDFFYFLSDGFLDGGADPDPGPRSFYDVYDQLFRTGYTGAARDDQSALGVLVRRL